MHSKFAERIAKQINEKKWKYGWKPNHLATWLQERFPNLTPEDGAQIKSFLPKK